MLFLHTKTWNCKHKLCYPTETRVTNVIWDVQCNVSWLVGFFSVPSSLVGWGQRCDQGTSAAANQMTQRCVISKRRVLFVLTDWRWLCVLFLLVTLLSYWASADLGIMKPATRLLHCQTAAFFTTLGFRHCLLYTYPCSCVCISNGLVLPADCLLLLRLFF